MKFSNLIILSLIFLGIVSSCKYDDYIEDFNYTSVYFGTQKPLRTIVARDPMEIKFGIALGGIRENTKEHWAKFRIEPGLLQKVEGASAFTLLPKSYYEMVLPTGDSTFIIPPGKIIGDIVLKIKKDVFTADPLATTKKYALPVRIYATSADSILKGNELTAGKDYAIIAVKYISKESGTYYVKGSETDKTTNITTTYSLSDLNKNKTRDLTTLSLNSLEMGGVGNRSVSALNKLLIGLKSDGGVTLSSATGGVVVSDLGSSYDVAKKTFILKYTYVDATKTYAVDEQIILRQDPELDLRFEEW